MDTTTFPYGYRFNFTFPSEVTINTKSLKGNIPYEFKIKKAQTGNSLTLEQAWTDDNVFTKKAGLDCTNSSTSGCSVSSESQKLNIKVGNEKKEGISSLNTGTGKIKMETDQQGYNQGLKFSIADGDVTLGSGGTGDGITKLEELETYEIAEYGGKYYLTKKTSPDELIKKTLSLPDECKLPGEAPVECTLDETKFKAIKFEGKDTDKPTGTATLTISKGNSTDFPFGYRFTFKTTADAAIKASSTTIKAKIPKDFKIKKGTASGQSTTLSLEKAWDDASYSLAAKVGLKCTGSSGSECCTMDSAGTSGIKLNVKKGTDKKEGITAIGAANSGSGKIKVEKDKEGYNQGLKFTISGGDVSLTEGTSAGGTDFDKLEELETYEITEEGGKYYLTRKTGPEDLIKSSLSIPEECFKNLGTSCSLAADNFKGINFDGKEDNFTPSGTSTLTVTKADKTDFPLGYRFTFNTTSEATIKSGTTTIKANIPTDFKIKKATEGGSLSLEKAWTDNDYSFAKKVGLTCTTGNGECCSLTTGSTLNVKRGEDKKDGITSIGTSGTAKIKVEKDKEGYNQGLKFTITGGDVSLSGGNKVEGSATDITKLEEYETYEITEEGGKYYLTRKDEAIKTIDSQLGLTAAGCSLSGTSSTCTLSTEQIKKINFEGKETAGASLANGTATLTIAKATDTNDFPLGYKFTLKSDSSDITIKSNTTTVKAKIPTEFKIKKGGSGQTTLSLEKAWSEESLGKKVGLSCANSTSSGECSIENGNSGKLKVRQNNNNQDVKDENLTKKSNSGSSAKIKVTKDQEGYNQGFKFEIEGGSIELNGSTASYDSDKINILDEYETYEIKEHSGKWYLTRKQESIVFIKKQLGLDFCSSNSWSRTGSSSSGFTISFNCDDIKNVENLKKIKIHKGSGGSSHTWSTGNNISVKVVITKKRTNTTSNFGEWEVEIEDSNSSASSVCVPDGNGGSVDLKSGNGTTAKYKINKGSGGGSWCLMKSSNGSSGQCSVS